MKVAGFRLSTAAVNKVATQRWALSILVSSKGTRDMLFALTLQIKLAEDNAASPMMKKGKFPNQRNRSGVSQREASLTSDGQRGPPPLT